MTPAERLECALSRRTPDRVPLYDIISSVPLIEHVAAEKLTVENGRKVMPPAVGKLLNHTRVNFPAPLGQWTDNRGFVWEMSEWFNAWICKWPWEDIEGMKKWVKEDIGRQEAFRPASAQEQSKALHRKLELQTLYGGELVIPAHETFEALQDAWIYSGLENFIMLDSEEPELVDHWISAIHGKYVCSLESDSMCRMVSPVGWIFDDLAFNTGLIFSPGYLRERGVFRRVRELAGMMHDIGLKVIWHSDGDVWKIIPDLIDSGIDALAPIDVPAGMDLKKLSEQYGDRLAFVGGIDLRVLCAGSPEDVRDTVLQAMWDAGRNGGFVLGSSSEEIIKAVPVKNALTMIETVHEYGWYPIGSKFPKYWKAK